MLFARRRNQRQNVNQKKKPRCFRLATPNRDVTSAYPHDGASTRFERSYQSINLTLSDSRELPLLWWNDRQFTWSELQGSYSLAASRAGDVFYFATAMLRHGAARRWLDMCFWWGSSQSHRKLKFTSSMSPSSKTAPGVMSKPKNAALTSLAS